MEIIAHIDPPAGRFLHIFPERSFRVQAVINPSCWQDGRAWLLVIGGHVTIPFLIFAYSEQDAIDEFVDNERFGHMILENDVEKIAENEAKEVQDYGGNYGKPIDLENVYIFRCTPSYRGDNCVIAPDDLDDYNAKIFKQFNESWLENGKEE